MDWFREQMKKGMNPRTYVLVGFLVVVLVWIHSLDQKRREVRARMPEVVIAPAPAVPLARSVEHGAARASATPEGWGSDPFEGRVFLAKESPVSVRPIAHTAEAALPAGLYLQGIMEGPMGRTALINGEIYHEGQRVGKREVIQIGRKAMLLLDNGNDTTLVLKGDG